MIIQLRVAIFERIRNAQIKRSVKLAVTVTAAKVVKLAVTVTAAKVVKLAARVTAAKVVKLAATATAANSEHFLSSIFYFSITSQAYPKTGRTLQTELFYHTYYLSNGRKSHYFCCQQ